MRKLLIVQIALVFLVCQAGMALARTSDTGPGCGLGKLAWKGNPGSSKGQMIMMATTNGFFGNQTFGISSGTIGCTSGGGMASKHKVTMFASVNFETLSQEMAQGQGEHLAALSTLMNVPEEYQADFNALTQAQYTTLIESGETSPAAMVTALRDAMAAHPVLAKVSPSR